MTIAKALERPLSPAAGLGLAALLVAAGAIYCTAYTSLQGEWESPTEGALWALVNLLPWLAAFELGKRIRAAAPSRAAASARIAILLAGIAFISMALGLLLGESEALPFELVRRLPAAALVAALLAIARGGGAAAEAEGEGEGELPFLPGQIAWIGSAGNYVEIRAEGRVALRRMTMQRAEALLAGHGFLRIHRRTIVNAARIEEVRRGKLYDEVLIEGRWLRVGGAYRHLFRHFVPSS
jgi:DNA-binding LytR/AlgR family response regulator